jgi:hypothetical protein
MTRAASKAQIEGLSEVQLCALRFIPLFHAAFAFLIIAQANGYLG